MADEGPSKTDLQTVFRRLKGNAANKVCFDCGARNPTWASVTYGVFICIDCSATHRGLGVHITFVRSTNLDTNWTWLQLRAMQLGGNGNATQFFKVHGCNTGDAQQKYRSRAAALYRDKLLQMSTQAHRLHGPGNLMLDIAPLSPEITADVDFFAEHTAEFPDNGDLPHNTSSASISADAYIGPDVEDGEAYSLKFPDNGDLPHNTSSASIIGPDVEEGEGPNVDHVIGDDDQPVTMSSSSQKSVIAKKPVKKATLGAKKGGLGAQRIKTDFEQIEQKATDFDKVKDSSSKLMMQEEETVIDSDKKKSGVAQLSARLTMQSIDEQHKAHEKMKAADPSKAEVVDRLGMGGGRLGRPAGVSHSIASGIKPIKQEGSSVVNKKGQPSSFRDLGDQWEIIGKDTVTPKNNEDNDYLSTKTKDDEFFDAWDTAPPVEEKKPVTSRPTPRTTTTSQLASNRLAVASGEDVQKKFGNAKAISSEQYFGGDQMDYETKSNLTKFEGSTGIGSSDLFGNGQSKDSSSSRFSGYRDHVPEMADIKDSVRQGVSKVAGKISSLSSSMSSYLGRPPQKH